jgi:hypothetical protein
MRRCLLEITLLVIVRRGFGHSTTRVAVAKIGLDDIKARGTALAWGWYVCLVAQGVVLLEQVHSLFHCPGVVRGWFVLRKRGSFAGG